MKHNRIESATAQPTVPPILLSWLAVFRPCFTAPVWNHILVLVGGAVLAPGKRTVTQALRVMGLADQPGFGRYHEVLNRARWDARDVARRLLLHLLAVLSPSGEVVIGIDDTVERRWGGKIKARGIYRDAVRSSHGHFVKTSGLRWLSLAVMLPVPFAGQALGLAVPHRAGAVGALERGARQAAQGPDRLGEAGDIANQTLAAGSPRDCRRRQRFLGIGTHRRGAPARLPDHQVASRRQFVRAGTQTPKGSNGTPCAERQTPA